MLRSVVNECNASTDAAPTWTTVGTPSSLKRAAVAADDGR